VEGSPFFFLSEGFPTFSSLFFLKKKKGREGIPGRDTRKLPLFILFLRKRQKKAEKGRKRQKKAGTG